MLKTLIRLFLLSCFSLFFLQLLFYKKPSIIKAQGYTICNLIPAPTCSLTPDGCCENLCGPLETPFPNPYCENFYNVDCPPSLAIPGVTPYDCILAPTNTPVPITNTPTPAATPTSNLRCQPAGFPRDSGIYTAVGCIPIFTGDSNDVNPFFNFVLSWAIGIAGGIAFILILYAGFMIITSSGHPEKLQAGKELLTAAIAGLLLIIFSTFLLHFIGVRIFFLPGL
ncbi:hypothetical protein A2Z22_02815 [Candidatus Woesebacteria bacterium RBG_16_34_12]|uniref:Uncharacterized protein n=1 Tax=Candidatus Woesebacteria bacterium RBG_16_34_12 TaxID=1802480 RepID=A0A1F7X7B3_9BACT|nr:MAG: hypothetical protein A2Z22_02815 [Candidatus Woesebacteria bacterium RBG_16_34_12]